jgi:hypothetical protein
MVRATTIAPQPIAPAFLAAQVRAALIIRNAQPGMLNADAAFS